MTEPIEDKLKNKFYIYYKEFEGNKSTQRVYNTFEKLLHHQPPLPYSQGCCLYSFQNKITIREIISENIKSFELNTPPQSCTNDHNSGNNK